jgi:hypothetical protein
MAAKEYPNLFSDKLGCVKDVELRPHANCCY